MLHLICRYYRSIIFIALTVFALATKSPVHFLNDGSGAGIIFAWIVSAGLVGLHEMDEVYNDYLSNKAVANFLKIITHITVIIIYIITAYLMFGA